MRLILKILIDTGLRPGELIPGDTKGKSLDWDNVSEDAGGTLPLMDNGPYIIVENTKTEGFRTIPLTEEATKAFLGLKTIQRKLLNLTLPEFFMGSSLSVDHLSRSVRLASDEIGLGSDVVLYTMRHTCASRLVQRGADMRRIMEWMGHKNIQTTLRYAKLAPKDLFEIKGLLEC